MTDRESLVAECKRLADRLVVEAHARPTKALWDFDERIELFAAIDRLGAVSPAPVPEPVAWRYKDTRGHWRYVGTRPGPEHAILKAEPLYAAPLQAAPAPEAPAAQPPMETVRDIIAEHRDVLVALAGREPVAAVPVPQEPPETPVCPECQGSGEVTAMTNHLGPDDYEFQDTCPHCNGSGLLSDAYAGVVKLLAEKDKDYMRVSGQLWGACHARQVAAWRYRVGSEPWRFTDDRDVIVARPREAEVQCLYPPLEWKELKGLASPPAAPPASLDAPTLDQPTQDQVHLSAPVGSALADREKDVAALDRDATMCSMVWRACVHASIDWRGRERVLTAFETLLAEMGSSQAGAGRSDEPKPSEAASLDALDALDAARYRWLAGNGWADSAFYATGPQEWGVNGIALLSGPQLDAAIDSAMKGNQQ